MAKALIPVEAPLDFGDFLPQNSGDYTLIEVLWEWENNIVDERWLWEDAY